VFTVEIGISPGIQSKEDLNKVLDVLSGCLICLVYTCMYAVGDLLHGVCSKSPRAVSSGSVSYLQFELVPDDPRNTILIHHLLTTL